MILQDNDEPGRKKALAAAHALHGVAWTIRIVLLPELPDGGDVSDWLDADPRRAEKLAGICFDAPLWQPPAEDDAEPKPDDKPEHAAHRTRSQPSAGLLFERMDSMQPEPVEWIWPGYLARGKLTLLAGDPGVGESQISLAVAAVVTRGAKWPDGSLAPRGSVLLLTAEDAAKDTVRPRLDAVDADLARVHRLKSVSIGETMDTFSLQRDLAALGAKLTEIGDVVLVVIDPITSYLGSELDTHRTSSVRAVLEPLADWAEQYRVGVLGITHPPKATQVKALHAVTGSLAFVAAARLVFIAVEEPETERRLLLPVKNNLGAPGPGLGYRLAQTIVGAGIVASYVAWDSEPVTISANDAVRQQPGDQSAKQEAKDFLREELANGAKPVAEIKKAAAAAGLAWRTVRRAQEELHIKPQKNGLMEGWQWELPLNWHDHLRKSVQ